MPRKPKKGAAPEAPKKKEYKKKEVAEEEEPEAPKKEEYTKEEGAEEEEPSEEETI